MALSSYALISVTDLRAYKGFEGSSEDQRLEDSINAATAFIEQQTNRKFVTRGAVTEYHTVQDERHTIELAHSPIISVTSVHESTDSPRVYDATTLLTAATDYIVISTPERAVIRRLSSAELYAWSIGYRCVQVIYSYGYANIAALPDDLKHLAKKLAYSMYKEADRGWHGLTNITDAQGSVTRLGRLITPDMQIILDSYTRQEFERTWEAA